MPVRLPNRRASGRPAVAGLVLLAAFSLTGCGPDDSPVADRPASDASSAGPTTGGPDESAEPSQSSDTSGSDASEDAGSDSQSPAPATLSDRLLTAEEVPGFNDEFRWTAGASRTRETSKPFGTCQRFDLASIGAEKVAERDFVPAEPDAVGQDTGGELVAEFPDTSTARRAYAVLKAWRDQCADADQLSRHQRSHVGTLQDVPTGGGAGGWYLLTYGPAPDDPDAQWFDAQGMAVEGTRIAMVELILVGQDYNYSRGHEPMVTAVRRAAAKLT